MRIDEEPVGGEPGPTASDDPSDEEAAVTPTPQDWDGSRWKVGFCEGEIKQKNQLHVNDIVEIERLGTSNEFQVKLGTNTGQPLLEKYTYLKSGVLLRVRKQPQPPAPPEWILYCAIQRVPGSTPSITSVRFLVSATTSEPLPDSTGVWGAGGN